MSLKNDVIPSDTYYQLFWFECIIFTPDTLAFTAVRTNFHRAVPPYYM